MIIRKKPSILLFLFLSFFALSATETMNLSFEETEGDIISDSSGYGNYGVSHGAVITPEGKIGKGIAFNGDGDCLRIRETDFGIESTNAFTIALWINVTRLPEKNSSIVFRRGLYIYPFSLHIEPVGALTFGIRTENGTSYISSHHTFIPDQWYHIAASFSDGAMTIYINGTEDRSKEIFGMLRLDDPYRGEEISLGKKPDKDDYYFAGILDEIKVHNLALPAWEIEEIYNEEVQGITPSPTPEITPSPTPVITSSPTPEPTVYSPGVSHIGRLNIPPDYYAYSPSMAYDPETSLGLAMYRYGKRNPEVSGGLSYCLGLTAFSATKDYVDVALPVEAFPPEENVHPGNDMPIVFDEYHKVYLFKYNHGGNVLRAAAVNSDLSITLGSEFFLNSVYGISPDLNTGKILVLTYSGIAVLTLDGLELTQESQTSFEQRFSFSSVHRNQKAFYIKELGIHAFYLRNTPGTLLFVKLEDDGVTINFQGTLEIPEATDYTDWQGMTYDPVAQKLVIAYRDNEYKGRISVIPRVSGQFYHAGSTIMEEGNSYDNNLNYNPHSGTIVLVHSVWGTGPFLRSIDVSGDNPVISARTPLAADAGIYTISMSAWYDPAHYFGIVLRDTLFYSY